MCDDPLVKSFQPEAKKFWDSKSNNLMQQIEMDEKAIEMTSSEFRSIKNELRTTKDKAIQMNSKLLEKQKAYFENEKKSKKEEVDEAVKDNDKAKEEAKELMYSFV